MEMYTAFSMILESTKDNTGYDDNVFDEYIKGVEDEYKKCKDIFSKKFSAFLEKEVKFMKISCKNIDKDIEMLLIEGFDLETGSNNLIAILQMLTIGESYYCEYSCENFFLNDDEVIKYRSEVPIFLDKNGTYIIKEKKDEEHFKSICKLTLNNNIYKYMPFIWNYFENAMFFTPTSRLSWPEYENIYNKIKPELYGIGLIQKKYANSVFIRGHDGDSLIFTYGYEYPRSLLQEVIKTIKYL